MNKKCNRSAAMDEDADSYAAITAAVGQPYALRQRKADRGLYVKFNKAWLAWFMIEKHQPRYERRDGLFRLGPSPSKVVTRTQLCEMISSDFREYLERYHEEDAPGIMAQLNEEILWSVMKEIMKLLQEKD